MRLCLATGGSPPGERGLHGARNHAFAFEETNPAVRRKCAMKTFWKATLAALSILGAAPQGGQAAQSPKVVVSIAPIHALVAGVMEGVGMPQLLVSGGASPHSYSLKPSQARALRNASLVVRVSDQLENFLERAIANLGALTRSGVASRRAS